MIEDLLVCVCNSLCVLGGGGGLYYLFLNVCFCVSGFAFQYFTGEDQHMYQGKKSDWSDILAVISFDWFLKK